MRMSTRRLGPALLLTLAAVAVVAGTNHAQDKPAKHDAGDLNKSLREVINVGAELFNKNADYAGCYRVYQGALLAVKPFLPPDVQQKVDASVAKAEQMPLMSDRAFELRKTIDEVRAFTKA